MPTTENKSLGHECVIASPDKYNKKHRTKGKFYNKLLLVYLKNLCSISIEIKYRMYVLNFVFLLCSFLLIYYNTTEKINKATCVWSIPIHLVNCL